MYNPFTDFINQIQKYQTVTNQPNRSNDRIFTLNTKITIVPTLSRIPLAPLNFSDNYLVRTTKKNPFQTNTKLNATANQCHTFYQPRIAPNKGSAPNIIMQYESHKPFCCKNIKLWSTSCSDEQICEDF